jgi:hypothetical protein
MASGINSTFRQVGIATGIAGLGAIFQHSVTHGDDRQRCLPAGTRAKILSAAHGQLGTLLESGEVMSDRPLALPRRRARRSITPTASGSPGRSRRSPSSPPCSRSWERRSPSRSCVAATSWPPRMLPPRRSPSPWRAPRAEQRRYAGTSPLSRPPPQTGRHRRPDRDGSGPPRLIPATGEHRQARIAGISWILPRTRAEGENRTTRCSHLLLVRAHVAQPGSPAGPRRWALGAGHA